MPKAEKVSKRLDCANNRKNVWLVKVPKYVSEEWLSRGPGSTVGKLKVLTDGGVMLESVGGSAGAARPREEPKPTTSAKAAIFSRQGMGVGPSGAVAIGAKAKKADAVMPREHQFVVGNLGPQSIAVYSEDLRGLEDPDSASGRLTLEGKIVKRAELRPPSNLGYMQMKARQFEAAAKPTRSIVSLDRAANKFKPVNMHTEDVAKDKVKRSGEAKQVRLDRDRMMAAVFAAFEKHQFYKLTDLAAVTAQPQSYVKEILGEVGSYNTAPPHKNMWELKEEYRHYAGMDQS